MIYSVEFPTFGSNPKLGDSIKKQISFLIGENNNIENLIFSPKQWKIIMDHYG